MRRTPRAGYAASDASAATGAPASLFDEPVDARDAVGRPRPDWTSPARALDEPGPLLDEPVVAGGEDVGVVRVREPGEGRERGPRERAANSGAAIPAPRCDAGHQRAALAATATAARRTPRGGPRRSVLDSLDDGSAATARRRLDRAGVGVGVGGGVGGEAGRDSRPLPSERAGSTPHRLALMNPRAIDESTVAADEPAIPRVRGATRQRRGAKMLRTYLLSLASRAVSALSAAAASADNSPGASASDPSADGSSLRFALHPTAACLSPAASTRARRGSSPRTPQSPQRLPPRGGQRSACAAPAASPHLGPRAR